LEWGNACRLLALLGRLLAGVDLRRAAQQVVEGWGELDGFYGLVADPDALEDGLVEESSRSGLGGDVGGLDEVGELQSEVEWLQGGAVVGLQCLEPCLGGDLWSGRAFVDGCGL
jgi:hypothetical protein